MAGRKVRVAVIGHGFLGRWHAEKAYQLQDAELVAIVESKNENVEAAKSKYPDVKIVETLDEVLDEIDAGVIVTPTSTHADFCKKLLSHNKHIFCEKPLVSTVKEVHELEELRAKTSGLVFQVGHSERCHEAWELLSRYEHLLKNPLLVRANRLAPFKGRATDVDVVQDLMMHDLDLLLWLFNDTPKRVKAEGEKMRTEHWDFVHCHIEFQRGWSAYLSAGRNFVREVRNLEIFHREGCLEVDLLNTTLRTADPKEQDVNKYVEHHSYEKRDHLLREQEQFYRAILEKTHAPVDFEAGKKVVELNSAILKSLSDDCWVELQ